MDYDKLKQHAFTAGFTNTGQLDIATIEFRSEVREACKKNVCGRYGKSWSCPPGCGTLDDCAKRVSAFTDGLIVQTVGELEDEYDGEGMMDAGKRHSDNMRRLTEILRREYTELLPVGAGSCTACDKCTYPDDPCRDESGAPVSMEALGMVVSDVCTKNGMKYYHGKNTITYVGCFLLNETQNSDE